MGWVLDHFRHHGLHDCDIAVQCAADKAGKQGDPVGGGKAKDQTGEGDAQEAGESNGLAAIVVRNHTPQRGSHCFCDGVGRDEQAGVKRSIAVRHAEILDHFGRVGEDGIESERLGKSTYSCGAGVSKGVEGV